MTTKNSWWGYRHINGSYQAKRYFSKLDIEEAEESPFCTKVTQSFEAESREEALKKVEELTKE